MFIELMKHSELHPLNKITVENVAFSFLAYESSLQYAITVSCHCFIEMPKKF